MNVKTKSNFEIIILREVVLAFYSNEIFSKKKVVRFRLVVLKVEKLISQKWDM